jgi:hypothetical protein
MMEDTDFMETAREVLSNIPDEVRKEIVARPLPLQPVEYPLSTFSKKNLSVDYPFYVTSLSIKGNALGLHAV